MMSTQYVFEIDIYFISTGYENKKSLTEEFCFPYINHFVEVCK